MAERKARTRADTKVKITDAFSNPAARIGYGTMDLMQATQYPITRMTQNYELLTSMYRDNWIVQNIVATIPDDMVRKWYEIKSAISPERIKELTQYETKIKIRDKILLGMYWGRLYGGAAGLILIKGHEDMSTPLDVNTVLPGAFMGLQILDRWSGIFPDAEIVTDPSDTDFGLPEYYTIQDADTGNNISKVHHSRIIRFIGRDLPWQEQVTENYWGESEIEAIYNEVVRRDNVAANMAALTFRANVNTLAMDGVDQILALGDNDMVRQFYQKIQAQSMIESNFGMRVVNKGDETHNTQYTFTGLADVYDRIQMDVAGAARTPVTKLFGRSPAGLNSTGESDMRNYYDYIDGQRETVFREIVERLLPIMAMSTWGAVPDDLEVSFPPMQTPDADKVAQIAAQKTSAIMAAYQNDLIDAATALKELAALSDETGMYATITDELIEGSKGKFYSESKAMRDPLAGLMNFEGDDNGTE